MKTYLVYVDGFLMSGIIIKASGHNAAEKKARKMFPNNNNISVEYTEL